MASSLLSGRVRPSKLDDEDSQMSFTDSENESRPEESSDNAPKDSTDSSSATDSKSEDEEDTDDTDASVEEASISRPEPLPPQSDISFGALASAQSSLGLETSRKRKRPSSRPAQGRDESRSPSPFREEEERRAGKKISFNASRSSKHAPTELSSKKAVSRKRSIINVPTRVPRDPRFSSLSGRADEEKFRKDYAFLDEYRKGELWELKQKAKKERDLEQKEALKQEARRMEDRERARKRDDEQRQVLKEHRKQERERVKEGKTPYFLKRSEVKKQALKKRFEELGEKKAEKVMEKTRKRRAAKDRKALPGTRRTAAGYD